MAGGAPRTLLAVAAMAALAAAAFALWPSASPSSTAPPAGESSDGAVGGAALAGRGGAAQAHVPASPYAAIVGTVTRGGRPAPAEVLAWDIGRRTEREREYGLWDMELGEVPSVLDTAQDERARAARRGVTSPGLRGAATADGVFQIDGADEETTWLVVARAADGAEALDYALERSRYGVRRALEIRLPTADGALDGRAVHHDGRPFAGSITLDSVSASDGTGSLAGLAVLTDSDGRFRFGHLSRGVVTLRADAPDSRLEATSGPVAVPATQPWTFVVDGPSREINGLAKTSAGATVPGARVFHQQTAGGRSWTFAGQSDASGRFALRVGVGDTEASGTALNIGSASTMIAAAATSAELVFTAPAHVRGRVVNAKTGAALPGAVVVLTTGKAEIFERPPTLTITTDGTGRFEHDLPPHEPAHAVVYGGGFSSEHLDEATEEGYDPFLLHLVPGATVDLDLRAVRVPRVAGRVVDPKGEPIVGAVVTLSQAPAMQQECGNAPPIPPPLPWLPDPPPQATDADGRFAFDGIPAGLLHHCLVSAAGWSAEWVEFTADAVAPTELAITLTSGAPAAVPPPAAAPAAAPIRGVLLDEAGNPTQDAHIAVRRRTFAGREASVGWAPGGGFVMEGVGEDGVVLDASVWRAGIPFVAQATVHVGDSDVVMRLAGKELAATTSSAPRQPRVFGGANEPASPEQATFRIEGRVVGPGGAPVVGLLVHAAFAKEASAERGDRKASVEARTDSNGAFWLEGLGEEAYEIGVSPPASLLAPPPVVARASSGRVEIRLAAAAQATITVLDDEGHPVAGAMVGAARLEKDLRLYDWDATTPRTSPAGRCRLGGLDPEGVYVLGVEPQGYPKALRDARIEGWKPADTVVRLERPAALSGFVRETDGTPIVGASIFVLPPDATADTPSTQIGGSADGGAFSIAQVSKGPHTLRYGLGADGPFTEAKVTTPATDVDLRLALHAAWTVTIDGAPADGSLPLKMGWFGWEGDTPSKKVVAGYPVPGTNRWRFPIVSPGLHYTLRAWSEEKDLLAWIPDLGPGGGAISARLVPGGKITGRLSGPGAQPYEGCYISLAEKGHGATEFPDKEGRFVIRGVPPGRWTLTAGRFDRGGNGETNLVTLVASPGEDVVLELPAGK